MLDNSVKTNKLQIGAVQYATSMSEDNDWKFDFFKSSILQIVEQNSDRVTDLLDVWACDWNLILNIDNFFGNRLRTIWIDIWEKLVKLAPKWKVIVWNWYDLNWFQNNSMDIITYSSFLHELWSYYSDNETNPFTKESYYKWIIIWLKAAERVLREWGYLLIKDPVRPLNDTEELILSVRNTSDLILSRELLNSILINSTSEIDITNLKQSQINVLRNIELPNDIPYLARMFLFINWFNWARNEFPDWIIRLESWKIKLSRWLLAEISRHMTWGYKREVFFDEQKEWYWSLNENEWNSILKELRLELVQHDLSIKESDHAKLLWEIIDIKDKKWNIILPWNVSPTHHYTILKKI